MTYNKLKPFTILIFILFISCGRNNNKEVQQEKIKTEVDSYQFDIENTKVIWNGYKTNDKVKVVGYFDEFSCDREDQEFSSIEELVNGLQFSIKSSSSVSGDPMRDKNLQDHFFKYLTKDFVINGTLNSPINDSIDVTFDVFGKTKQIRLAFLYHIIPGCPYFDHIVEIKGSINLESQFDALKAYNAISNKCYDLHKGADGISKTWKQVDVHVKALVINTNYSQIRQEDSSRIGYISIEEVFARNEFISNR
ncbi:MAG TPA: hypothetical protein EYQ09_06100 [Flavobacteriales bacterium]|nr:hypothetical protein [Flavobacteriales bacterium]HIL66369.1 hypothetical protein [Flavobacteriales bacterium]